MKSRVTALISPLFVCALVLAAPPSLPTAERIEIRLSQFDVVVRDEAGRIVPGLGPAEFTVFEDGAPMEVVAVDEWGAATRHATAPAPEPSPSAESKSRTPAIPVAETERRSFVLVFDALGESTALRMNQAKSAAESFARKHLRPDDLAAVYQLDLDLHAVSGITSNADEVSRGIDKITWMAASSLQDDIAESVLSYASTGTAPLMNDRMARMSVSAAQQLDWQREHVYKSLNDLTTLFRALPGRRVMVLVSPGFPMTTTGDRKTGAGGFTPKFRELIRSLAAYGVTVYSLDIGNDLAAGDVSEKIDWRVAVGKLGMDENTLADLGLERSLGSSSATSRREFLGVIAAESGGRLLAQTDLSKAFEAIQEESSSFYRISYRVPVTRGAERYRKLLVKAKTPGNVVTGRRGRYSDITLLDRAPSSAAASVESLDRYHPLAARGIAIPLPGSDLKKVPVEVVMEALGPIELPTDAQGGAALDIEIRLVARAEGEVVDRYERSFTARVKPDGVAAIRQAFRVEGRLSLVPGVYELQGSLRVGAPPQLASWSANVAVQPPPKGDVPAFTGALVVATDDLQSPLLSRPQIPDDADPLTLKPGMRILPTTRSDFQAGGSLLVLAWLRGIPDDEGKPPALDLSVEVADGQNVALRLPMTILYFGKEPSGGFRMLAQVDATKLPAGRYTARLAAKVTGAESAPARHSVSFVLRAKDSAAPVTSSSAGAP